MTTAIHGQPATAAHRATCRWLVAAVFPLALLADRAHAQSAMGFKPELWWGAAVLDVRNANFGAGAPDYRAPSRVIGPHTSWTELAVRPGFQLSAASGAGVVEAKLTAVGAATRGSGDAQVYSFTAGRPSKIAVEEAYLRWRSGGTFASLGNNALEVTAGPQEFTVGDSLLVGQGTVNAGRKAASWLVPRVAFAGPVTLRINTAPVRIDVFALGNRSSQKDVAGLDLPRTRFRGINVEWFDGGDNARFKYEERMQYVGLLHMQVHKAEEAGLYPGDPNTLGAHRSGLRVTSLRAGMFEAPGLPSLSVFAELARQSNGTAGRRVDARAYNAEIGWAFDDWPWKPRLLARAARYSGDADPTDDIDRSWDPMFLGSNAARNYGATVHGEIVGQGFAFNSNLRVRSVGAQLQPVSGLRVYLLHYRFQWDQPAQFGSTERDLASETNLLAEWQPRSGTIVYAGLATARPSAGAAAFFAAFGDAVQAPLGPADRHIRRAHLGITQQF